MALFLSRTLVPSLEMSKPHVPWWGNKCCVCHSPAKKDLSIRIFKPRRKDACMPSVRKGSIQDCLLVFSSLSITSAASHKQANCRQSIQWPYMYKCTNIYLTLYGQNAFSGLFISVSNQIHYKCIFIHNICRRAIELSQETESLMLCGPVVKWWDTSHSVFMEPVLQGSV